jgi:hypothetical protein
MKAKIHTFTIKVRFDKKCTSAHAIREVRDNIHGNFYPMQMEDTDPGEFWVRAIRPLPRAPR